MSILPGINDDCALAVIAQLDKPSLAAVSQTSKLAFHAVGPYLVQDVALTRSEEQVLGFCRYVLAHNLANTVRHLYIDSPDTSVARLEYVSSATYSRFSNALKPAQFASALADVLERTTKLESLDLGVNVEELIKCEPRVAPALIANPPSAKLRLLDVGKTAHLALRSLRSPPHLILGEDNGIHRPEGDTEVLRAALLEFLSANAERLRVIDLDEAIYKTLDQRALRFPNVEMITIPGLDMSMQTCARVFPSVRYFNNPMTGMSDHARSGQHGPLWRDLRSAEGMGNIVVWLARHHPTVRRLHMWMQYGYRGTRDAFGQVCDVLRARPIVSLGMAVEIPDDDHNAPFSGQWLVQPHFEMGHFWPGLAAAIPQARFLHLCFRRPGSTYMTLEVLFAALTHETISSLDALPDPRYVLLRYIGHMARADQARVHDSQGAFPSQEDVFSLWFSRISSLEYHELDLKIWGWKRSWWRRQPLNDRPGKNPYGMHRRIIRV
ncbi:hypothetical protein CERSUDRAFT_93446 [Gelatoporia subvermispora B]|uniref:F-box domain-containing protein n=1 Tax=Ceriporiopsis subvermispora (strain B) TaxID=914234 RepID=M2RKV2_CERS8|nr:hypothetical protein CERSUDRAFT_93446 [Gelatoporia subvermispora B]